MIRLVTELLTIDVNSEGCQLDTSNLALQAVEFPDNVPMDFSEKVLSLPDAIRLAPVV